MIDRLITTLHPHDRALTAAALRRSEGERCFFATPGLYRALIEALEASPPPADRLTEPETAEVIDLAVERAKRRPAVLVEGQASPRKPVRPPSP